MAMSAFGKPFPPEASTIGDTKEYNDLRAILGTLGDRDFAPQESMWAKMLRMKIDQIPIHIPSDRTVSQHTRASFKLTTGKLLVMLDFIQCSDYTIDYLKEATFEVTKFNAEMIRLLGQPATTPKDVEDTAKTTELSPESNSFYQSVWTRSNKLFKSLIRHLQPCTDKNDKHRAMLHLTQHSFSGAETGVRNDANSRGFCMLLASCRGKMEMTWQHTEWIFAEQEYSNDAQANQRIQDLCLHAEEAYCAGECLAIKVTDSSFSDVSVTLLDQRPPPRSATPTKSLLELSCTGALRAGGNFSPDHKIVLAYALSHSLLYLHDESAGPWLQHFWTLRSIFFLHESNKDVVYDIHHPYISCELDDVKPPLDIKQVFDQGRDRGFLFIQAFGKLLLELAWGDEAKTLLSRRNSIVNIPNLMDLNKEIAPEDPGESYRKVVAACLTFPKIWNEEQQAQRRARSQPPLEPVSAQDVLYRRIVEPLRKAVDDLGPESLGPADLVLRDGGTRLDTLALPSLRPSTASAMGRTKGATTGPRLPSSHSSRGQQSHPIRPRTSPDISRGRFTSSTAASEAPRAARRGSLQSTARTRVSTSQQPSTAGRSGNIRARGNLTSRTSRPARTPITRNNPCSTTTSVQMVEDPAVIMRSPGTLGKLAAKPSIHLGFGRCFATKANDSESSRSIQDLQDTVKKRFQHWETDKRIRIAVLDTGIDDDELAKYRTENLGQRRGMRVVARSNFCVPLGKSPDENSHDLDGHGTRVASIILNVAQNIDLYIARVCRGADVGKADLNKETEFKYPEPAVVARAVKWAVENEVDVINLSLGYRDEQEHPGISELRVALEEAAKKQILVFAATSNEGLTADVAWPAKNLSYAIGIHSNKDNGRPSDFIGKASNEANLMVVGENIPSRGRWGQPQLCSGTSFATPVAAAIGAMILAFVGQEICQEQVQNIESAHKYWKQDLRTNRGMRNVLESISDKVTDEGGTYYRISKELLWRGLNLGHEQEHAFNIIAGALKR